MNIHLILIVYPVSLVYPGHLVYLPIRWFDFNNLSFIRCFKKVISTLFLYYSTSMFVTLGLFYRWDFVFVRRERIHISFFFSFDELISSRTKYEQISLKTENSIERNWMKEKKEKQNDFITVTLYKMRKINSSVNWTAFQGRDFAPTLHPISINNKKFTSQIKKYQQLSILTHPL